MMAVAISVAPHAFPSQPSVAYTLRIDTAHTDGVDVAIRVEHAPATLRLAMKVHPEYDARYWRYLDAPSVDGTATAIRRISSRS